MFTTLDMKNGFIHVNIDPASITFTAFVKSDGHFEILKVPFGLFNSPAVFQRFVNMVFLDLRSRNKVDALNKLERVLQVAEANGVILRSDECHFLERKVSFLGHILENGTVRTS